MFIGLRVFVFCACAFTLVSCADETAPSTERRVKVEALTPPMGPPIYVTRPAD